MKDTWKVAGLDSTREAFRTSSRLKKIFKRKPKKRAWYRYLTNRRAPRNEVQIRSLETPEYLGSSPRTNKEGQINLRQEPTRSFHLLVGIKRLTSSQ